jgi:hemolysin activation/secretion protein
MRLKMGLRWCEVVIKDGVTKHWLWRIAPFGAGIAVTGSLGAVLAQSRYVEAAPCCTSVNPATPTERIQQLEEEMREEKPPNRYSDGVTSANGQSTLPLSHSPSPPERWDASTPTFLLKASSTLSEAATNPLRASQSLLEFLGTQEKVSSSPFMAFGGGNLTQTALLQVQNPSVPSTVPTPAPVPTPVTPENLQPNPNQERFLQPPPNPTPVTPNSTPPIQPSPTPTPPSPSNQTPSQPSPSPTTQTVQVKKINVTGSTIFTPEQLNRIVQPYEGQTLTLEQLREAADKITQLYLDQGYITSRAILREQVVSDGVVEIVVLEGSLEEIQVEGTRRVKPSYIRSRVQLGAGKPLNTGKLEDQLRLLRADPLFENVEASLRAGTRVGQSILIVRVTEANPFEGSVGIDNYSPPSVGSERLGLNLLYRNLTGYGDDISASYYHTTTSGADTFDFSYRLPLNPMNGTLQLRAAPNRNKITQEPLNVLDIRGQSELYEISFRQPLIRSPREEFALSLGFTYQDGQTFLFGSPAPFGIGPEANGVSSTRVIKFGQDYLRRDVKGAWSLRSLFSIGIGTLGATINPDPIPDGRFVSWLGQVQRVQILNENNFLIVGADIQLTPDSLLPSQQFVIGGGQSLRGYRQNVRSGDNGVRFSLEDRITLQRNEAGAATFQLAPFFDSGIVWNKSDNPNNQFLPSQRFLAGIGMGLIWEAQPGLTLRLDYGYPLIDIKDRGTNAQDEGFYFSVRYQF